MAKIKFDIPTENEKPISVSFKLYKSEVSLIESYTDFLSTKHKQKIEKEIVLKGLLKSLLKDKEYKDFIKKDTHRFGAVSDKKSKAKNDSNKTESEPQNDSILV